MLATARPWRIEWGREISPVQAIRLSGWLFLVGGSQALATVWFLPDPVQNSALLTSAGIAMVGAAAMLVLPASWATPALVRSTPYLAIVLLSLGAGAWGGALQYYVALYALTFLYVGLTQGRGYALLVCGLAMVGASLSTLGNQPLVVLPFLVCSIATSAFIGLVLESCMRHQRSEQHDLERVLAGGDALHRATDVGSAAKALADNACQLLGADGGIMVMAEPARPQTYRGVAVVGVDLDPQAVLVDTRTTDTGVAVAVRQGSPIFVADADSSPIPAAGWVSFFEITSLLYLPVHAPDGTVLGVQICWWQSRAAEPKPARLRTIDALVGAAGQALDRLRAMAQLDEAARTDALTGLPNRRRLNSALDDLPVGAGIVMCDLDHFKHYNDEHGHDAGDRLLISFAAVLQEHTRGGDTACRFGGEEFALVTGTSALAVVERIRAAWSMVSEVTFSAGVAVRGEGEPATVTFARADRALYQAKRSGRNRIVVDHESSGDPRIPTPRGVEVLRP
jgi:diguanylate cyclase (GGDEF)-like protein